jgi:hypothetical protein
MDNPLKVCPEGSEGDDDWPLATPAQKKKKASTHDAEGTRTANVKQV